jgi:hypothetical protein
MQVGTSVVDQCSISWDGVAPLWRPPSFSGLTISPCVWMCPWWSISHVRGPCLGPLPVGCNFYLSCHMVQGAGGGQQVGRVQNRLVGVLPPCNNKYAGLFDSRMASSFSLNSIFKCRGSPIVVGDTPLVCTEPSWPAIQASMPSDWALPCWMRGTQPYLIS